MTREALVPLYFHLGGVAGGSLGLAALAVLRESPGWRAAAPPGLLAAPLLLAACGAILTGHLTQPARFWRVLTRFKLGSPISVGAWSLAGLSLTSGVLAAWMLSAPSLATAAVSPGFQALLVAAALLGWFLTAYTGVLLTASSRAVWTRTHMLGAVFCVAGLAAGAAWLRLLLLFSGSPEVPVAAAALDRVASRLLVLSTVLWVALDRSLLIENEYHAQRGLLWAGLLLGYALPVVLIQQGGATAEAGALLALTGGVAPRAAIYRAGEKNRVG